MEWKDMDSERLAEWLESRGVKPTANRLLIVKALAESHRPLSVSELETAMETIDKSVIFRNLTLFRKRHLLHVVEDGSDGLRYELCLSHRDEYDDDTHAHFFCEQCHTTYCLHDEHIPMPHLPEGYEALSVNYLVKGRCPACRARRS